MMKNVAERDESVFAAVVHLEYPAPEGLAEGMGGSILRRNSKSVKDDFDPPVYVL